MNNKLTDRMGTAPILSLLLKMSLPMIFSMLVTALYNIVDGIFVASVNAESYAAVTLVFPLQTLILAFALGVGVGTNAIVSRRLGERNVKNASECAETGMFLAIVIGIFFAVFGVGITYAYVIPFTKDDPLVRTYALQYLSIVMCLSIGLMVEILGEKALQATGNMRIPMISQLIGAITNIVLDALFIKVFQWGVIGAAVATILGQLLAMTFVLIYIARHNPGINIFFKNFKLRLRNIKLIINVGIPTLVVNAVTAFTTMILNAILKGLTGSLDPVTVLGTYFKLQSFVFMPVFGITQGAFPILGYNFGAHNKKRFLATFKWATLLSLTIMIIGTIIFQVFPDKLILMLNPEGNLVEMGSIALREISWCFIGAAFGIIITSMFQSLGRGLNALLMSLLRQIIILIPAVYIFGRLWGLDAAWWAYPFAEAITLVIFAPIAAITIKKDFEKITNEPIIDDSHIVSETTNTIESNANDAESVFKDSSDDNNN